MSKHFTTVERKNWKKPLAEPDSMWAAICLDWLGWVGGKEGGEVRGVQSDQYSFSGQILEVILGNRTKNDSQSHFALVYTSSLLCSGIKPAHGKDQR